MTNQDAELESWRAEWRAATPPVPDLGAWVRRQRRKFVVECVVTALAFAVPIAFGGLVLATDATPRNVQLVLALWGFDLVAIAYTFFRWRNLWSNGSAAPRDFLRLSLRRETTRLKVAPVALGLHAVWTAGLIALFVRNVGPGESAVFLVAVALAAFVAVAGVVLWYRRRTRAAVAHIERLIAECDADSTRAD